VQHAGVAADLQAAICCLGGGELAGEKGQDQLGFALKGEVGCRGRAEPGVSRAAGYLDDRLAASEEMPAHEKVRSPLGHPPRRHRSRARRGEAPHRHRSLQRAVILTWLITSIAMVTVAVILSRGGPASCPQAFGICGG